MRSPLRVIGGTLIGGIVIGGCIAILGRVFYLIIVFPLLMGLAGGVLAAANVLRFNIKQYWTAALIGLAVGALIYGSYRYIDYLLFVRQLSDNKPLYFFDYLHLVAKFGTSVGTLALQVPLSEMATWIYWLIETLVVLGLSVLFARNAIPKPIPKPETS